VIGGMVHKRSMVSHLVISALTRVGINVIVAALITKPTVEMTVV